MVRTTPLGPDPSNKREDGPNPGKGEIILSQSDSHKSLFTTSKPLTLKSRQNFGVELLDKSDLKLGMLGKMVRLLFDDIITGNINAEIDVEKEIFTLRLKANQLLRFDLFTPRDTGSQKIDWSVRRHKRTS